LKDKEDESKVCSGAKIVISKLRNTHFKPVYDKEAGIVRQVSSPFKAERITHFIDPKTINLS